MLCWAKLTFEWGGERKEEKEWSEGRGAEGGGGLKVKLMKDARKG